jgi:hypothetical protein
MVVLTILIAWFFVTLFHELSHAFFAKRRGAEILAVYPYWHWYYPDSGDRFKVWPWYPGRHRPHVAGVRWRWAGYRWRGGDTPKRIEAAAPLLMDAITISLAGSAMLVTGNVLHPAIFILFALIDAGVWVKGYLGGTAHTDGGKFRNGREETYKR